MAARLAAALGASGGLMLAATRTVLCDSRGERVGALPTAFDPEALERGAKALREINTSANAKKVLELAKQQELTRLQELKTREAEAEAAASRGAAERERVHFEELRKTHAQQAQTKAQLARYEDELARKRMAAEHEAARERNAETVRMQEAVAERQEALRQATEEKVQAARRQTDAMKAELERETLRAKALAEAEGRAAEARASEDVTRRLLLSRIEAETTKAVAVLQAAATNLGEGARALLTDPRKLGVAVGGATALALGVYGAREGTRFGFRYLERVLGQPSLVRETSRRSPWQRVFGGRPPAAGMTTDALAAGGAEGSAAVPLRDVVLEHSLAARVRGLAAATAATREHGAPFRNMMFYGPPGTGKTLAAKRLARYSGLDYAVLSGGDVAPLGSQAVTEIHALFDWAAHTRKGMLLFIDEADAFLSKRGGGAASEEVRAALNALLFRTGSPSRDVALVLATNRPEDLDAAVLDRVDDALEFPLPGEHERLALIRLYFARYISGVGGQAAATGADADVLQPQRLLARLRGEQPLPSIDVAPDVTEELFVDAATKTEGFSGRELAKLMSAVQAAVYGSPPPRLLVATTFMQVVDYKVKEHAHKREIIAAGAAADKSKKH